MMKHNVIMLSLLLRISNILYCVMPLFVISGATKSGTIFQLIGGNPGEWSVNIFQNWWKKYIKCNYLNRFKIYIFFWLNRGRAGGVNIFIIFSFWRATILISWELVWSMLVYNSALMSFRCHVSCLYTVGRRGVKLKYFSKIGCGCSECYFSELLWVF